MSGIREAIEEPLTDTASSVATKGRAIGCIRLVGLWVAEFMCSCKGDEYQHGLVLASQAAAKS